MDALISPSDIGAGACIPLPRVGLFAWSKVLLAAVVAWALLSHPQLGNQHLGRDAAEQARKGRPLARAARERIHSAQTPLRDWLLAAGWLTYLPGALEDRSNRMVSDTCAVASDECYGGRSTGPYRG
jgi:hypothetical protein